MDGGAWWAAVQGVAEGRTRLRDFTFNFHFSLSCIGEGNGNPLQCSCLENPRDGGAWWAAVSGVAQSRTRLKRLSSSSSSSRVSYGYHSWGDWGMHRVDRLPGILCSESYDGKDSPPQQKSIQPKMSVVPKLGNSKLGHSYKHTRINSDISLILNP